MPETSTLYKTGEAAKRLGIVEATVRAWADDGKLSFIRTAGGQRRYDIDSFLLTNHDNRANQNYLDNFRGKCKSQEAKKTQGAIYCRVSSHKQKDDLQRQIQSLQEIYPKHKVFKDICSGLNYKRSGLSRLLVDVQEGTIKEVVVAHKDRLARFGTELIEWILMRAGATLIIQDHKTLSPDQELTEDLLAIVHVFSCRLNGKRRYSKVVQDRETGKKQSVQGKKQRGKSEPEAPIRQGDHPFGETLSPDPPRPQSETTFPDDALDERLSGNVQLMCPSDLTGEVAFPTVYSGSLFQRGGADTQ